MRNRKMAGMRHSIFAKQLSFMGGGLMLLLFLAWSCKKNDEPSYPQDYWFKSLSVEGPTQVFSNGIEITDEKIKKGFVDTLVHFSLSASTKHDDLKLSFVSDTTAFFLLTEPYSYKSIGNTFTFTSSRSLIFDRSYHNYNWDLYLWKHIGNPRPYPEGVFAKSEFIAYSDRRELSLPYTAYKIVRTLRQDGVIGTRSMQTGITYNEFNEKSITTLGLGDTLAIRRYMVHLVAK